MPETDNIIKKIESFLPDALSADRHFIRRKLFGIKRSGAGSLRNHHIKKRLYGLEKLLFVSINKKLLRKKNLPDLTCNPVLPITAKADEIIDLISKNRVVIITGETGSGKSTQIPKLCLAAKRGVDGMVGCTQPRRIAATAVAHRIAEELGENLGESVGYKIRFKDRTSENTYIKIMTDGILLAETLKDPLLNRYDTIIVDEAHERSLNIDFILGILKTLLKKRDDLKLIITSATIDTEKFSKAFGNAPSIKVSGRMFPVEVRYFSTDHDQEKQRQKENNDQAHIEMAVKAVDKLVNESPRGDILVFMPTEQDIRETCDLLEGKYYKGAKILPLFARLSGFEQSKIFSSATRRKIIIATNIAETSITIPGIKYVIDTGLARISQYTPGSRTTALPVLSISKSSADQRKGRCGRVENGVCIRLFSEDDFNARKAFTLPEILRTNLAEVILKMIALKLGNISEFPFIDQPAAKNIKDGFDLLFELGAIIHDRSGKKPKPAKEFFLTKKGKIMAGIPVDPRLSGMLVQADKEGCLEEIMIIASALSIHDPRMRPGENAGEADMRHARFYDASSDFITFLNIWNKYHATFKKGKGTNKTKRFCRENFLSFNRMRNWRDIHAQLFDILKEYGLIGAKKFGENLGLNESDPLYMAIHKSILSGFLSNIAVKKEKNMFDATRGKQVMIFPGSTLFNKAKTWIVAAEMLETSRLFARTAASIDNSWIKEIGRESCSYTYLNPHWERNKGEVVADRQINLFSLIIDLEKSISYGKVNPDEATDIFIRNALVQGDVKKPFEFMKYNQSLIDEIETMENKVRRKDLLVNEEDVFQFYKGKLEGIYDIKTLANLLKKTKTDNFLRIRKKDLLLYSPDEEELSLFPDNAVLANNKFQYTYSFKPEKNDDGVTIKIPSTIAPTIPSEKLDWLVPGLYREKITAYLKGLPKEYRKKLLPIAKTVNIIFDEMPQGKSSLITALGEFIYKRFNVNIPASAWPDDLLPDHLKMRISITDSKGKEIRSGRDTAILLRSIPGKLSSYELRKIESVKKKWEKTGLTKWDFSDLPDSISLTMKNGNKLQVYPGIEPVMEKNGKNISMVNLRLFHNKSAAVKSHKNGIAALLAIHFSKDLKFLKKSLRLPKEVENMAAYFGGARQLEKMLYKSVTTGFFHKNIRSKDAFYSHAKSAAGRMHAKCLELSNKTIAVLKVYHETRAIISKLEHTNRNNVYITQFFNDLKHELEKLVPNTFIELYEPEKLNHIVRYVKAIDIRAQRAFVNFEKDHAKAKKISLFNEKLDELLKGLSVGASGFVSSEKKKAIEEYFWLLEEYKISLFAQEIKTAIPVSKNLLEKKIKEIDRIL